MKAVVVTLENKQVGEVELSDAVYALPERADILTRAINWQRAGMRQGTHKTKDVSEVSGSGKKLFRQKGTGRSRAGYVRAPERRGGGTVFGPVVRSHATKFPKKLRVLALKTALSEKARNGSLIVLEDATAKSHKTKEMAQKLSALGLESALIVHEGALDENFAKSVRNIPNIDVLAQNGANVFQILKRDKLVLTKAAALALQERLS